VQVEIDPLVGKEILVSISFAQLLAGVLGFVGAGWLVLRQRNSGGRTR